MSSNSVTRRDFLKTTAAGAATVGAASAVFGAPAVAKAQDANERIRVGFIGCGGRMQAHLGHVNAMRDAGIAVEPAAVCDVYDANLQRAVEVTGVGADNATKDYRELIARDDIDVVCIATPDHWHAKMIIEAAQAGKDVYCEKPMTHTIDEARQVVEAVRAGGRVMTVGVQSMADPRWAHACEFIRDGGIGKVVQAQTQYYRNSSVGQWRYYALTPDMTPATIDWDMWLGHEFGLAPQMPFDRAVFAQWRCYWPFGGGMYTDLFVHQLSHLIRAIGVRFPRRVVGAGGLYLEYDGRDVPDVATVVADYDEGLQVIVTATMVNDHPIEEVIRGHTGTILFKDDGYDILPQQLRDTPGRPDAEAQEGRHVSFDFSNRGDGDTRALWEHFLQCCRDRNPETLCPPELGYAAIATVNLGVRSYREGKVFFFDKDTGEVSEADSSWATRWEERSRLRGRPNHVIGWRAGDTGSLLYPPDYMALAGPWIDGQDPAAAVANGGE